MISKASTFILGCIIQPLLVGNARDGATPSEWPTETMVATAIVEHRSSLSSSVVAAKRRFSSMRAAVQGGDRRVIGTVGEYGGRGHSDRGGI